MLNVQYVHKKNSKLAAGKSCLLVLLAKFYFLTNENENQMVLSRKQTAALSNEDLEDLRQVQHTLLRISKKERFFWNITLYVDVLKLVKKRNKYYFDAHGKKRINKTSYILTQKGKNMLKLVLAK